MGGRALAGTPSRKRAKSEREDQVVLLTAPAGARLGRELAALALLVLTAFAVLSLTLAFFPGSSSLCGPLGRILSGYITGYFGYSGFLLLALVAAAAIAVWSEAGWAVLARICAGGLIVLASAAALGAMVLGSVAGGSLGDVSAAVLHVWMGAVGSYLVVATGLVCGVALLARRAPTELIEGAMNAATRAWRSEEEESERDGGSFELGPEASIDDSREPLMLTVRAKEQRGRGGPLAILARAKPERAAVALVRERGDYQLPPLTSLDTPPMEHAKVDEEEVKRSASLLEQKLGDFGVEGKVVEVQPGPVVTMYKFEPASGVKVSQIVNLADDLSMALKALAIRIQAPVPGEAVVGIEVPNRRREKVYLREILESEEFAAAQSHLTIALGKDISGQPVVADLARMPHLLIAGATGSGKSVSIHTMIASILFNATADDVRFILIDPKMLELSVYDHIPHLLVPVVVEPDKAAASLLWATQEMERRYRMMRDMGVRNIDGYNRAIEAGRQALAEPTADDPQEAGEEDPPAEEIEHRKLFKMVIVIDELADLLLSEGKTVERDITRIAQKARAAGIHLILATQRPSVDVITGLIKANLPARISLQVTSRVDSRTILDSIGAERLLGEGDMLFMPPGTAKLRRLHGPFVSEEEIRKVTDFLRGQGTPDYRMEILETARGEPGDSGEGFERDEMYDEAVRIVLETNQASISMLQRRLRVGYNRAARMVEQMEREGLVAPGDGARPREVRSGAFSKDS
ncbi:MAG TPA: DNA translocase FtsK [Candidatus Binataceae bacterium]|nr:DNA translocase FtsK [Candidatus Binataceae bacterium]